MNSTRIFIPNCFHLSQTHFDIETFIGKVLRQRDRVPLIYDMSAVSFLRPYGVLMLLYTARHIAQDTGYPVLLLNVRDKVHSYLERVDLFEQGLDWILINQPLREKYARNSSSDHLLELTCLDSIFSQVKFVSRARTIMTTWLRDNEREIDQLVTVLSEVCNNVRDHSGDSGHVMIQRYEPTPTVTEVHIAVGDLGVGIASSLARTHGPIARRASDYINLALRGYSARGLRQGGAGLQRIVKNRISQKGGELSIRSDDGLVIVQEDLPSDASCHTTIPGTQVSVILRSAV